MTELAVVVAVNIKKKAKVKENDEKKDVEEEGGK